jgi:hypothetical protein
MSDKFTNKNKIVSIRGKLYNSLSLAAEKAGFMRDDGEPDVGGFVNETLPSFGLETDDVKFVFRVPKDVSQDPEQLKLFLQSQVEKAVTRI